MLLVVVMGVVAVAMCCRKFFTFALGRLAFSVAQHSAL